MVERVKIILNKSLKEVVGSALVIELLTVYSALYLNGGQPGHCERCIRDYYTQLKKNGMEQAERVEAVKNRTLVPNWDGLKYVSKAARHFSSDYITDKEAFAYLKTGQLSESSFKKLPESYQSLSSISKKSIEVEEVTPVTNNKPKKKRNKKNK